VETREEVEARALPSAAEHQCAHTKHVRMNPRSDLSREIGEAKHDYRLPSKRRLSQDVKSLLEGASDHYSIIAFNHNSLARHDGTERRHNHCDLTNEPTWERRWRTFKFTTNETLSRQRLMKHCSSQDKIITVHARMDETLPQCRCFLQDGCFGTSTSEKFNK
jgi:hypothetical protein